MSSPNAAWIDELCRLPLLDDQQRKAVIEDLLPNCANTDDLADQLQKAGLVTGFQLEQLKHGQGGRLLLGQYVLLDRLGEGAMGEVYKARHRLMHRVVALKVIRKEHLASVDALQRFHREIRAAAQLSHPNVVLAYDADQVGDTHFMVMEFVDGIDLGKLVKDRGPLPIGWACEFMRQSALGLQHAHERGMVHRDVKPSNLLLTWTDRPGAVVLDTATAILDAPPADDRIGVVKILDMGLARLREGEGPVPLTQDGQFMGTPDFISPEQAMNARGADHRADQYSLGCTLYYFLSGRVPFPDSTMTEKLLKHHLNEPDPIEALRKDLPPTLAALVRKLMAKKPEQRFRSCAELAAALTPFSQEVRATDLSAPRLSHVVASLTDGPVTNSPPPQAAPALLPSSILSASSDSNQWPSLPSATGVMPAPPRSDRTEPVAAPVQESAPSRRKPVKQVLALVVVGLLLSAAGLAFFALQVQSPSSAPESPGLAAHPTGPTEAAVTTGPATKPGKPDVVRPAKADHYAFLLGVSKYASKELQPHPFADSDLGQLADLLRARKYRPQNVILMTADNGAEESRWLPHGANVRQELSALLRPRRPDDSVVVSIACQAVQFVGDEECYLCPADARLGERKSLIPLSVIYQELQACPAGFKLLLLDVCRRNPGAELPADVRLEPVCTPQKRAVPEGVAVLFSSAAGEAGQDAAAAKQGVFFGALRDGLRRDVADLEEFVRVQVFAAVTRGSNRQLRQTPERRGSTKGPIPPLGLEYVTAPEPSGELNWYGRDGHNDRFTSVAFAPDGLHAVSGSYDQTIRLWNLEELQPRGKGERGIILGPNKVVSIVRAVAFSPDGAYVLAGMGGARKEDGTEFSGAGYHNGIRLYNLDSRDEISATSDVNHVTSVAFSADGQHMLGGGSDATIRTWRLQQNLLKPVTPTFKARPGALRITSVATAGDGKRAAYASVNGTVCVWDLAKAQPLHYFPGPKEAIRSVAFSPDSHYLLTGGDEQVVSLWDVDKGVKVRDFNKQHTDAVRSVAFTPDGTRAVSGGVDGTVRLWDIGSGKQIECFQGSDQAVNSVAVSPDGRHVLSGGDDQKLHLWALPRAVRH